MKIGFNVKVIKDTLGMFEQSIIYLDNRVTELENKTSTTSTNRIAVKGVETNEN